MPPSAMGRRRLNYRIIMGIMMGLSHLEHGVVASGSRSPGINTLAPHPPHCTIFKGLRSLLSSIDTIFN